MCNAKNHFIERYQRYLLPFTVGNKGELKGFDEFKRDFFCISEMIENIYIWNFSRYSRATIFASTSIQSIKSRQIVNFADLNEMLVRL